MQLRWRCTCTVRAADARHLRLMKGVFVSNAVQVAKQRGVSVSGQVVVPQSTGCSSVGVPRSRLESTNVRFKSFLVFLRLDWQVYVLAVCVRLCRKQLYGNVGHL